MTNRLGDQKSPYLLQHKDNPVWWQPWGQQAFDEAERRNVPVFLSIGYSTCHWCHVMEHESFEDPQVAALMNEFFVNIKLDREERPDIDAIYMDSVQLMTGSGGWPMSVFLTHDRKPFFGGTYFPKDRFTLLLNRINELWNSDREQIEEQGRRLTAAVLERSQTVRAGGFDDRVFASFLNRWTSSFDERNGGLAATQKFPAAADLRTLLRIHRRSGDESALQMATKTLDAMAFRGLYDHLGGGFHRYTVDSRWDIPHFEKMLYDQASLAHAYLDAFELTDREEYALVVRETCDYVIRDMTHSGGGYFSAEDADSEGEEGKFYVFTKAELTEILGEAQSKLIAQNFDITEAGNFEHGTNHLILLPDSTRANRSDELQKAMDALFETRSKRIRPHLDDKVMADWNGLMIAAMARAGRVLNEPRYIHSAQKAGRFILEALRDDQGRLLHTWRETPSTVGGFLDDYAYFIEALIELYQTDFDPSWLEAAIALQGHQDALFWDEERGDYFSTDGSDPTVLTRRVESFDNVRPAGRSVAVHNLLRLGDLTLDSSYAAKAARVLASTPNIVMRAPTAYSNLMLAVDYARDRSKEIAVIGDPNEAATKKMIAALRESFQPSAVIAVGLDESTKKRVPLLKDKPQKGGAVTVYVCEGNICKQPTTDAARAAELARQFAPLELSSNDGAPPKPQ